MVNSYLKPVVPLLALTFKFICTGLLYLFKISSTAPPYQWPNKGLVNQQETEIW